MLSVKQQMAEEENRSADFLSKLTAMTKKNKESKQRTKINQHKLAWFKQFRTLQAREKALEDELKNFLLSNPSIAKERRREQEEQVSKLNSNFPVYSNSYAAVNFLDERYIEN